MKPPLRHATGVVCLTLALAGALAACAPAPTPSRTDELPAAGAPGTAALIALLAAEVSAIDADMPGDFGVYVRRLGTDGGNLDHADGARQWYLSSTTKVPVAIAVLERVDAGTLSLQDTLVLTRADFVDGAGDILEQTPGTAVSIGALLEKMLRDSDSTATDMLIRHIGVDAINRDVQRWTGQGFSPITTIMQVRYDAYGPLHPGVATLDNLQMLALRDVPAGEPRLQALADTLGVARAQLDATHLDAVFDNYYATGRNAATLPAFAGLLEQLVTGQLLTPASTEWMLAHMRAISTGTRRIQTGLPAHADFAQKTGTQLRRACNVGVLDADRGADGATIVVACAEDYPDLAQAETAFQALGRALHRHLP